MVTNPDYTDGMTLNSGSLDKTHQYRSDVISTTGSFFSEPGATYTRTFSQVLVTEGSGHQMSLGHFVGSMAIGREGAGTLNHQLIIERDDAVSGIVPYSTLTSTADEGALAWQSITAHLGALSMAAGGSAFWFITELNIAGGAGGDNAWTSGNTYDIGYSILW